MKHPRCPHCGKPIDLGAIISANVKGHKKNMTPAAMEARKAASAKGVAARQAKAKERRKKGEVSTFTRSGEASTFTRE